MIARVFSRPVRLALGTVLLICVLLIISQPASGFAQTSTLKWSRPIPLSGALASSRLPSLVAQDDGNVFLFWTFSGDGRGDTVYVSKYDNGAWLRPVDVLVGGPRILALLDGRQQMHLLFNESSALTLASADTSLATSVQGWTTTETVTHGKSGLFGDMVANADGTLDVVWLEEATGCKSCYSIAFEKHGLANPSELTYRVLSDAESVPQQRLQILSGPEQTRYVMWDKGSQNGNPAGIALDVSTNDGAQWLQAPRTVSFDQAVRQPLLFLDKSNQLVLAFDYGNRDETYYSVSSDQGTTWSTPQPIPGLYANLLASPTDYFASAMDSGGITHLIAAGRTSKDQQAPGLYHIAWDGKQWSNFNELYHADTLVENPAIAIGNGNRLHVSFATRDRNTGSSIDTSQVWYTNAQTDAPAATRVPLPTFTPQPTSTLAPTDVPTATRVPSPTPVQDDSQGDAPPTTLTNSQLPIIAGVVPVILILLVVFIWATVFRRRS